MKTAVWVTIGALVCICLGSVLICVRGCASYTAAEWLDGTNNRYTGEKMFVYFDWSTQTTVSYQDWSLHSSGEYYERIFLLRNLRRDMSYVYKEGQIDQICLDSWWNWITPTQRSDCTYLYVEENGQLTRSKERLEESKRLLEQTRKRFNR